ncbi:NusG domain II-containing protein [Diplocloster modestus]|uniref:NusG domain II-containing protein n=1 Tax=Diplocloster modestus TaxID=2850322 RepID=A0ABS6KCB8_9FIRM|nr:NusG domain II-containing protein [Diplocloster modestus]MBU9728167.1 NusG domain II-containing protein [Diplocloster modestus]
MRKNDWMLLAAVIVIAAGLYVVNTWIVHKPGKEVVVTVEGKLYGTYPLSEDTVIDIQGTNRLEIRDGKADMVWADCPDKLCVHQKAIQRNGETIVCLPNQVVAEVKGAGNSEGEDAKGLDAVAH